MESTDVSPGRGGMVRRDWTQGSILKNLLMISWPMTVTQTLMSLGPTIDMIWVGRLGYIAVAAVGVSGVVVMLAMGVMMGLTMGMVALISRAIGAKDIQYAHRVAQQAVVISAAFAILMALIGHFFGEKIVSFITPDREIISLGTVYLRIEFIGGATMTFRMMMDAIMQASGDTVNPMRNAIIYRLIHIALCPFLIFGWSVFPELGVPGAAYTSIIAQSFGVVFGLWILLSDRSRLRLSFEGFRLDFDIIWRIVRIGLPASLSGTQRSLSQFFLQIFIAPFGSTALAAHTIAQRLEMFLLTPIMSFGMGAGVLVGQNLGARKPERAERSTWLAIGLTEAFIILVSLAVFIWTGPVIRIFNNDPVMGATATTFIHIAIAGWVLMGFMFVLMSCLQGAGDTIPTMVINIVSTWVITMPLAYLLPRYTSWGVIGIRWAMSASIIVGALANVAYFRIGRWKTRRF